MQVQGKIDIIERNDDKSKTPAKLSIGHEIYLVYNKDIISNLLIGDTVSITFQTMVSQGKDVYFVEDVKIVKKSDEHKYDMEPELELSGLNFTIQRMRRDADYLLRELRRIVK